MRAIARTCACEAVQPHASPYPSLAQAHVCTYTYMYVYLQCMHTYIYKYRHTYTHMRITRLCYAQLCAHTWAPAHARAHTSAHTRARASAVPPRTTARAASTTPPRASRLRWRAARAGKGGAYHVQRGDTRGVPRADVRVERRRRAERLRAEPPAVHAGGKALACVGADACAPNRTRTRARARTQHTGACVRRARIGDPFICVDIYIHTCRVRWLYIPGGRTHACT